VQGGSDLKLKTPIRQIATLTSSKDPSKAVTPKTDTRVKYQGPVQSLNKQLFYGFSTSLEITNSEERSCTKTSLEETKQSESSIQEYRKIPWIQTA